MELRSGHIWFLVIVFLFGASSRGDTDSILLLQRQTEELIEKVLESVHNFYHKIKNEEKCIPDEVPDKVMGVLKKSIECIEALDKNDKVLTEKQKNSQIHQYLHRKAFLKCFKLAKVEVQMIMSSIDLNANHCPENMTEKTYEINVTTSYTKQFMINIKNGLEVTKVLKTVRPNSPLCLRGDRRRAESETEPEIQTETESQANSEIPTETENQEKSRISMDIESHTESEIPTQTESQTESEISKENKFQGEFESESEYKSESESDSPSEFESQSNSKNDDSLDSSVETQRKFLKKLSNYKDQSDDTKEFDTKNQLNKNNLQMENQQNSTGLKLSLLSFPLHNEDFNKHSF